MPFKKSTISAIIILVSLMTVIGLSGLDSLFKNRQNRVDSAKQTNTEATLSRFQPAPMEKISFTTNDNIKIAADLYGVENPLAWLVLVHMMPATKESFSDLAQRFQNIGYESIAFDLRGHGESDGGPNDYLKFSDSQTQKSILDLDAAVNYLIQNRGATPDKIIFIGASIGANLALRYVSEHPEIKTAVLISAGLDYHGIKAESLIKNLKAGQKIFFVSAQDDDGVAKENQQLFDLTQENVFKKIKIYDTGGHGTNIFLNQPDLISLIVEFIK